MFSNTKPGTRVPGSSRTISVAAAIGLISALLLAITAAPASASTKLEIGGQVTFADGAPASGVDVDLFEAASPWQRSDWLGSRSTGADGRYQFDAGSGCFIVVFIAPLGSSFDVNSADSYDQRYVCVDGSSNLGVNATLYGSGGGGEDPKTPPPTHPPTPTTAPPTTHPPTTAPPTTHPPLQPPPYLWDCRIFHIGVNWDDTFYVILRSGELPPDTEVILLDHDGVELERRPFSEAGSRGYNEYLLHSPYLQARQVSLQGKKTKPSTPKTCTFNQFSPVGLDLDGSGAVERISGEFAFDFDADGATEAVSEWFAPTEGILFDSRFAGPVTGEHLFGDQGGLYTDGYAKLARLDADADGEVAGAELDGLAIWTDANSNAIVDSGEVSTLAAIGVTALSTSHIDFVSEATLADGSTMVTEDLWFPAADAGASTNPMGRVAVLSAAGLGLLALAAVGARRRRGQLDAEIAALVDDQAATS
ncbi:MAG: hypothetical protein AAF467_01325 [Actinomycetota bacterium]